MSTTPRPRLSERDGPAFFKHLKDHFGWRAIKGGRNFASGFVYARPGCTSTQSPFKLNEDFYISELFVGAVNGRSERFATELSSWAMKQQLQHEEEERQRQQPQQQQVSPQDKNKKKQKKRSRVVEDDEIEEEDKDKDKDKDDSDSDSDSVQEIPRGEFLFMSETNHTTSSTERRPVRTSAKKSRIAQNGEGESASSTSTAIVALGSESAGAVAPGAPKRRSSPAMMAWEDTGNISKLILKMRQVHKDLSDLWNTRSSERYNRVKALEENLKYLERHEHENIKPTQEYFRRVTEMMSTYALHNDATVDDLIANLRQQVESTEAGIKADLKKKIDHIKNLCDNILENLK